MNSFLPCQSLQTVFVHISVFLPFDHPLSLSFFLCFEAEDRHKPTNDKHTTQTGIFWVVGNNLGREKKEEPRVCWIQSRWKTEERERGGKIRQTEEERTNSTPTGVVNEHEKYMKGLFPHSDGWARLWNTNISLSQQNIPPFTLENKVSIWLFVAASIMFTYGH